MLVYASEVELHAFSPALCSGVRSAAAKHKHLPQAAAQWTCKCGMRLVSLLMPALCFVCFVERARVHSACCEWAY